MTSTSPLWVLAPALEDEAIHIEALGQDATVTRRKAIETAGPALAQDRGVKQ